VRVFIVHHVNWSINSVCHVFGKQPFRTNDAARNQPLLAVFTFGEAWHNAHHAFPTLARQGVLRGQIDVTGRMIWLWEKLGWATDARWPYPELLEARRVRRDA
jgi:stearoyl-CoA desaturase (Delta-9 desaturase)